MIKDGYFEVPETVYIIRDGEVKQYFVVRRAVGSSYTSRDLV